MNTTADMVHKAGQQAPRGRVGTSNRPRPDDVRRRATRLLAWSLWGVWAWLSLASIWLSMRGMGNDPFGIVAVGYATVGALLASRHPRNAVGWLMLGLAVAVALQTTGEAYTWTTDYPAYLLVGWFTQWFFYAAMAVVLVFIPLLFPDGRIRTRGQRSVAWLGAAATLSAMVGAALKPDRLDIHAPGRNPLGLPGAAGAVFGGVELAGQVTLGLAALLAAVSVVGRFRHSRGVERQQLKWFTFAGLLLVVSLGVFFISGALTAWSYMGRVAVGSWPVPTMNLAITTASLVALLGNPIATGVAILRHRLYDIDVVINRTVVYVSLSGALAGVYAGSVLLLGQILNPLTGSSDLAVAGSTLLVAALFRPARSRIQQAVDRRFYRRKYDAARTLDQFAHRLRHELDLDALGADLCAAAEDTMQPAHVSLWLRR